MGSAHVPESEDLNEKKVCEDDIVPEEIKEPDKIESSVFKARGIKTIVILVSCVLSGISSSAFGPSFVDLQFYLPADTRMMALAIPLQSGAALAGSFFALFGFNKLSSQITMGLMMMCTSTATMLWASVRSIYWFLTIALLRGFINCLIASECQPYCLHVWTNHRFQKPVVHSIHALFSLGLTIGPFIVTPFLADLSTMQGVTINSTDNYNSSGNIDINGTTDNQLLVTNEYENATYEVSTWNSVMEYTGNVKYAFVTVGMPLLVPGMLFLIISLKTGAPIWRTSEKVKKASREKTEPVKVKTTSILDRNILLTLTFAFYVFIAITESVPLTYFTLYVTTVLHWKTPQRTLINSAFHGTLCFGRVLAIFLSRYFKQRTILAYNVSIILIAAFLLLLSPYHDAIMWLSASLLGLGTSTLYGALLLWLSETINVTSRIMSAVIISLSVGSMLGPFIVGQLFAGVSPMWIVYMVVGAAILDTLLYLTLLILEKRRHKNIKNIEQKESLRMNTDI